MLHVLLLVFCAVCLYSLSWGGEEEGETGELTTRTTPPPHHHHKQTNQQVAWANAHVEEAHAIMVRASSLAHEIFHPDEVTCYTGLALAAYGRLLGFEPELRPDVALFE